MTTGQPTVTILSQISGLSEGEIMWMFNRLRELKSDGVTTEEAKKIVKAENPYDPRNQK